MRYSFYKKLTFAFSIIGSMFLASCGSSSGGGDEDEFEFNASDLTNKYWYANPYLSSDYNRNDALIVYRFEGGGVLKKQEFSGRRDVVVGEWSLVDDKLIIEDESISADDRQEWFIQTKSTSSYLKLNSSTGTREFYTNIDEINDVTADAYLVCDLRIVNNSYVSSYKMEYVVYGNKLSQVKVLPDASTSYEMDDFTDFQGEKVYYLKEGDRSNYFDVFTGNQLVKFNLKFDNGESYKLDEQVYESEIEALDNFSNTVTHASGSGSVTINWKAINENNIYYYIEVLDKNKNEYQPKYRSTRQSANAGEEKVLEINNSTLSEFKALDELVVGEDYYVKISGFKYEDGIDPDNSSNKETNIQAVTRYIFKAGSW
ncbi:hypothetical protein BZG02_01190 [Labilibaculum filiforme]|uniref:Fibronectin type-III domain-containing protein n=1 Tax=Labilibaculum filiforme TaxID=1940526 RepID=A0A2N3I5R4_9BACT|nr:hypothetical protein [Labilibaculum filiforme]PKQ65649.1 hypothetical protein BZG02_01190 [Labilibaculum filiforme]